jgi:hypothetical protein
MNGPCIISDLQQVREYSAGFGNLASSSLLFSPRGQYLLVLEERVKEGKSPRAFIVDPPTGKVVHTLPANEDPGQNVLGFTPRDNLIIWQPKNRRCQIRRLPSLELAYRKSVDEPLLFSPGKQFLVARDGAEKAPAPWLVWDLSTGTSCPLRDDQGRPFREGLSKAKSRPRWRGGISLLMFRPQTHFFSPDSRYLVLVYKTENGIRVWETSTGKLVLEADSTRVFDHGTFSNDGKRLAIEMSGRLMMFDVESAEKLWQIDEGIIPQSSSFLPYSHVLQVDVIDAKMAFRRSSVSERKWLDGDTGEPTTPEKGLVTGEYRLVHEPVVHRWLAQPPTTRVQIFHLPTNKRLYDFNVPKFEEIQLSKDGRTLLTKHTKKGDRYYIWSLPPERSAAQFVIPLGIGIGAIVLFWAWRLRNRARQMKTECTANSPSVT